MIDLNDIRRDLPTGFVDMVEGRPAEGDLTGDEWLEVLPRLVRECAQEWDLRAVGPIRYGMCGLVVPVQSSRGGAAFKISWPHVEAKHEHLALRAWDGQGAVRLLAADPNRCALLLELLDPDRELSTQDVDLSTEVIGRLLRRLDRPAMPQLVRLSTESARWAEQLRTYGTRVLPRRIVDRAAAIFTELGQEDGVDSRLVHTDLHDMNVLAAEREPWLAIDPKPIAGVPEFGVAPLVWNRAHEARQSHSIRAELRRRIEIACDAGELDVDRAMLWTLARCAQNAAGEAENDVGVDDDMVSWWVTCCKAMQD
ncbi:aminoglycoside phosphotransferase family protein [Demetria terragena]|uniref:aminoglycoside phosphotransferase family protein n=1 Tax=Demetria terragena TaxID=63959 RepID=UPI0003688EDB|nr:aminoglycoside phosphotransferase family protein [Demetria terragena]